ncbi:hypothetical protein ABTX83_01165 [Streptomyces werraensis]|uniref:hypothetical protein n=1 Tax=Streptomyces werraensis TaxID=68284 RepID=UPI00331C74DC
MLNIDAAVLPSRRDTEQACRRTVDALTAPGADGLLGKVAKDPHEVGGGRAGDAVFCRVPGAAVGERWGSGWRLDVVGLPVTEVGGVPSPSARWWRYRQ